jgi:hypothetical protein
MIFTDVSVILQVVIVDRLHQMQLSQNKNVKEGGYDNDPSAGEEEEEEEEDS